MNVTIIKNKGRCVIKKGQAIQRFMGLQLAVDYWWMKPIFGNGLNEIPQGLQLFVGQTRDEYIVVIPTTHHKAKGQLIVEDGALYLESVYPTQSDDVIGVEVVGKGNILELITHAVQAIAAHIPSFKLRETKTMPVYYDYFGWCTWDVFYREVSEAGVLDALHTFKERKINPYFMILDDGWQDVEDMYLNTIFENNKFPSTLKSLIETAKKDYGIKQFGIWHALQGYWGGLNPDGPLAKSFRLVRNDYIEPSLFTKYMTDKGYYIHEEDISKFYQMFYKFLFESGIDLVKVDSQGSLLHICEKSENPTQIMHAYQEALHHAGTTYFNENVLYCMSHPSDVIFSTNNFSAWRNSDDFFPNKPIQDQLEHFYINAFNNVLTSTFAYPDWDMFQTNHPHAIMHALVRAISGGPVYICDAPKDINTDILNKLIINEHEVLRFNNPALPLDECLMVDPTTSSQLFKVKNSSMHGCTILAANVSSNMTCIQERLHINEHINVPCISFREDFTNMQVNPTEVDLCLNHGDMAYVTMVPLYKGVTPLGLIEKYNAYLAIHSVSVEDEVQIVTCKGHGVFGFYVEKSAVVESVVVNGQSVVVEIVGDLLYVSTQKGENTIEIKYKLVD